MAKIKKKASRPQSAAGDEFRSIAGTAADFYRKRAKQFNTVLTVLVIVLAVGLLYSFVSAGKEQKAGQMLDAAYSYYASSGGAAADLPRALEGFKEVVTQYGGTLSGAVAQYYVGNVLMAMARYDEAAKAYEEFLDRYAGRKTLVGPVYTRMGYAYESLGNREGAEQAFQKAEAAGGAGPATLELARIYERTGRGEEAQQKYRELSEQLPATSLALEARSKLPPPDLKQSAGEKEGKAAR